MGWKGALIGSYLFGFGGGPLGAVAGAFLGHFIEGRLFGKKPPVFRDELSEAYAVLGVSSSADNQTVRAAYREKAKKYHPDTLKAQGLSDELVGKATAMMSKVNAAWMTIKKARGL